MEKDKAKKEEAERLKKEREEKEKQIKLEREKAEEEAARTGIPLKSKFVSTTLYTISYSPLNVYVYVSYVLYWNKR